MGSQRQNHAKSASHSTKHVLIYFNIIKYHKHPQRRIFLQLKQAVPSTTLNNTTPLESLKASEGMCCLLLLQVSVQSCLAPLSRPGHSSWRCAYMCRTFACAWLLNTHRTGGNVRIYSIRSRNEGFTMPDHADVPSFSVASGRFFLRHRSCERDHTLKIICNISGVLQDAYKADIWDTYGTRSNFPAGVAKTRRGYERARRWSRDESTAM